MESVVTMPAGGEPLHPGSPAQPQPLLQALPAPVPPLTALRRWWPIGLLLALVGLAGGLEVGNSRPVLYTAQASLAVGGQDLSSFQVAGFALAAQQIASNYARYVGLPQSQKTFKRVLGARAKQVQSVSGSPIANSNIILVEVVATSPGIAISGSNAIAALLMREANAPNVSNTAAVYLSQFQKISQQVYAVQTSQSAAQVRLATMTRNKATATALAIQQSEVNRLSTTLATLLVQQKTLGAQYTNALTNATTYSRLVSAQTAVITLVSRRSTLERFGLAGLVLGGGLGLVAAVLLDRLSVRRRLRRLRRRQARDRVASAGGLGTMLAEQERAAALQREKALASAELRGTLHGPAAGDPVGGDPVGRDLNGGDPVGRDLNGGDLNGGDVVAGEPDGDPADGDAADGDAVDGDAATGATAMETTVDERDADAASTVDGRDADAASTVDERGAEAADVADERGIREASDTERLLNR